MSTYEKTYDQWNDAVHKFDYYIVGIIGAGLVVLIRDLKIERLDFNSDMVRATGVFFLMISFITGLARLERQHMRLRFENEKIKISGYRERLKSNPTEVIRESNYERMTTEEVEKLSARVDANFAIIQESLKRTGRMMAATYSIRNWCLLAGLVLLFLSVFVDPILKPKTEPNKALQTTTTAVTECAPSRTFRASCGRV